MMRMTVTTRKEPSHEKTLCTQENTRTGIKFGACLRTAVWALLTLFPGTAWASGGSLVDVICDIVELLQSDMAGPVATAGVIWMAAMAMFGRASWGAVMIVVVGVAIMFGAQDIVLVLVGESQCGASTGP